MASARSCSSGPPAKYSLAHSNGWPTLVADVESKNPKIAARSVVRIELDRAGKICEIDTVVASAKLAAVPFERLPSPSVAELVLGMRAALLHPPLQLWAAPALAGLVRAAVSGSLALGSKLGSRRGRRKLVRAVTSARTP
ncbi:MAG TPA: hypothetical protein VF331_12720 [Polyangiales bacterium]